MESPSNPTEEALVKEFHRKRELIFCLVSVVANISLPTFWYLTNFDLVDHVRQKEQLPSGVLVFIVCMELFKVVLVMITYPLSNVFTPCLRDRRKASIELGGGYDDYEDTEEDDYGEIPKYDGVKIWERDEGVLFGRRDKEEEEYEDDDLAFIREKTRRRRKETGRVNWTFKVLEIVKGIFAFALSVGTAHVLIILFGAPVLADKLLTLQFSAIVVTWLFLPLCINIPPATVIFEVLFMRFWDTSIEWVHRSQLRFIVTLFGAWCGAIAFPLDWDRPWQRWPIPCVVSVFVVYTLFHCLSLFYLTGLVYSIRFRRFVTFGELNKVKMY